MGETAEEPRSVVTTLTRKQRLFVEHYLKCWNATEAARVAGYKWPNKIGPRLLNKNPQIQAAITERLEEAAMSANEVLARLTQQASASMGDFLYFPEQEIKTSDGETAVVVDEPQLSLSKARERGQLGVIKKYKLKTVTHIDKDDNETITEWLDCELYDAQAALVHLGRYHGLWKDRLEHDYKTAVPITIIEVEPLDENDDER